MSPFGKAISRCCWAALKVHRGAWSVYVDSHSNKKQSKLFLQNNSFLTNKQILLDKLHSLQLGHLPQSLCTHLNPLKICHGTKSLPPSTCHNLSEKHCNARSIQLTGTPFQLAWLHWQH